ncbi:hypothetical protein O6H91_Y527000 [Diphasiastrum complanatum]|nr:hypothetical protein O6H91_Y527000 [Diphasiastrum complanatum]
MELCEEFIDDAIQQSWQNNIAILSSLDLNAVVSSEEPVLELRTKCISELTSYALEIQSSENYSFNDFLDFLSHLVKMEKDMLNLILTFFRVQGVTFANSGDYDEGSIGLLISGSPDDERVHCNISTVLDFLISGLLIHVERPNEQQGSVIGIKTLRSYLLLLLKACSKETLPLVTLEKIEKLQWLFLSAFNVDDLTNLSPNNVLPLIPNSFSTRSTLAVELYSAKHLKPNHTSDVADGIELVKVIALIERYLVAICERTVSMTSMESMVELAKLVANARDSHDILFDAFSALLSRNSEILDHNSRLLGSVIDAAKLSETALERALSSNFPLHHGLLSNFVLRQIEDLKSSQEENVLLKRKLDQRDECISCKSCQEENVLLKRKLDQRDECISCKSRDISAISTISTSDHNKEKRRPISKFTIFVKPSTGKTIALLVM